MANKCETIQETIAVGLPLTGLEQEHLGACETCSLVLREYQVLKILVADLGSVQVPEGFADAVMSRIDELAAANEDWPQAWFAKLERALSIPHFQYFALAVGGAVSLLNLVSFVFFVVIPV
jgi:hypothetical protein